MITVFSSVGPTNGWWRLASSACHCQENSRINMIRILSNNLESYLKMNLSSIWLMFQHWLRRQYSVIHSGSSLVKLSTLMGQ